MVRRADVARRTVRPRSHDERAASRRSSWTCVPVAGNTTAWP